MNLESIIENASGGLTLWIVCGYMAATALNDTVPKRFRIKQNCDWTYTGYVRVLRWWGWWWLPLVMTDTYTEIETHDGKYGTYTEVLELIQKHYGKKSRVKIMTWNSRKSRALTSR